MSRSWTLTELEKSKSWRHEFTEAEIYDLTLAVKHIQANGIKPEDITSNNFQLPVLGKKLKRLAYNVNSLFGIASIRGFPLNYFDEIETIIAYIGISSYFGNLRPQNKHGWLLSHIRDFKTSITNTGLISQTNGYMAAHTDSCDVVGLLCLSLPDNGGGNYVASSLAILEHMELVYPDYTDALRSFFPYDRRGEKTQDQDPWYMMPIVTWHESKWSIAFNRQYIEMCQDLYPDAPRVSKLQWEAIACFESFTRDPFYKYNTNFEPGTIQFLNNHVCVHGRESYVDTDSNSRHLLRLWLSPDNARPLPDFYSSRWGSTTVGNRGGVNVGANLSIPLLADAIKKLI